jgi:hypothetical protein
MYLSPNGNRAWMEVTEPILRSYVSWRMGKRLTAKSVHGTSHEQQNTASIQEVDSHAHKRIKTSGLNTFVSNMSTLQAKHSDSRRRSKNRNRCFK